jgi:hypothetical protein
MPLKNKIKIFLSFSLLLQAMVFPIALPNLVLCFGGDGHIAFEVQDETNHCAHNDSDNSNILLRTEYEITGLASTDCTDINLHFYHFHADIVTKHNPILSNTSVIIPYDVYYPKDVLSVNNAAIYKNMPQFNSTLDAVKKTILLI